MKRLGACLGVGAMLVAFFTSPLFHFHDHDEHGGRAPIVHAHFFESESTDLHHENEVEAPHAHHAKWVDFFTFSAPSPAMDMAIDFTATSGVPPVDEQKGVLISAVPRAHSPPEARFSKPRSPPTI